MCIDFSFHLWYLFNGIHDHCIFHILFADESFHWENKLISRISCQKGNLHFIHKVRLSEHFATGRAWSMRFKRLFTLDIKTIALITNCIYPLSYFILSVLLESQKYFCRVFRVNLYFRFTDIIIHVKSFIRQFISKFDLSIS